MKYGLDVSTAGSYSDPRTLAELAAAAEQAGWDGFFLWDALLDPAGSPFADPWVALAAIALATRRIRIGVMVVPLARRRPWQVAREAVSLDHLSQGRLIVGVGLGYQAPGQPARDFTAFGEDADPRIRAEKLDEGLAVMAGLWSGERFSFRGKQYHVDDVIFRPNPVQSPRIPVWIAGYWLNRGPFRRAARWDGVVPGKVNDEKLAPEELREILAYVQAHRESAEPLDVAVYGKTPADPGEAAAIVQPWMEAGATWWREGIEDGRGSFDAMQERIRRGPPSLPSAVPGVPLASDCRAHQDGGEPRLQ